MSLEQVQNFDNKKRVNTARITASNDPQQAKHDANELIRKGAIIAAHGRAKGWSEEETLKQASQANRRQRSPSPAEQQARWEQMQATTGDWEDLVSDGEIAGIGYEEEDEIARAFGQDQSDYQNFQADDRGFTQDEETGAVRAERWDETRPMIMGEFESTRRSKDGGTYTYKTEEPVGYADTQGNATQALKDAIVEIRRGGQQFGYHVFPGAAQVEGRLEDDLKPNREAERSLVREMVKRDNAKSNPTRRAINNIEAQLEAEKNLGENLTMPETMGNLQEVRSLGKVGETAHVVRSANDAITSEAVQRQNGGYVDADTGESIRQDHWAYGPELPAVISDDNMPNNGSSSDLVNAPQTAQKWMEDTRPDHMESKSTFGNYPQVDISLETTNFSNVVRDYGRKHNIPELAEVSGNIRNIDELNSVVASIQAAKQAAGKSLVVADPQNPGEQINAGDNVVSGAMHELRMNEGAQSRLANALFQLDAAKRSTVNENPTGIYLSRLTKQGPVAPHEPRVSFGVTGETDFRQLSREKGGTSGRELTTLFREIKGDGSPEGDARGPSPDSTKPYIAMPAAMPPPVASTTQPVIYNRTGETSSPAAIRSVLTEKARGLAKRDKKPFGPNTAAGKRNESNVQNAIWVTKRKRAADKVAAAAKTEKGVGPAWPTAAEEAAMNPSPPTLRERASSASDSLRNEIAKRATPRNRRIGLGLLGAGIGGGIAAGQYVNSGLSPEEEALLR